MTKHLYILGSRGIPARYGGFETFAERLALYMKEKKWRVTVYCQGDEDKTIDWNGITCVWLKAKGDGAWATALFDWRALCHARTQPDGIWLTLGFNTGFFNWISRLWNQKQIINMDGIEWQRRKWSWPYRIAFFINYLFAGFSADLLIADNPHIEHYLQQVFASYKIRMIAYGANAIENAEIALLDAYDLHASNYALVIARPEPENHILEIVRAWSNFKRNMKLVVLGNLVEGQTYHDQIKKAASGEVVFTGGIYDTKIVQALRLHAAFYIHGHSVGGTNPSLVEALGAGNAVVAHNNPYNRWVAGQAGLYFKDESDLVGQIKLLLDNREQMEILKVVARKRHEEEFLWPDILAKYENVFSELLN